MRSRLCHLLALGLMLGARAQTTAPQPPSQEDPPAASQQAGVLQPGILEPGIPGRALFERGILGGGAQAGGLQGATFAQARIDMTSDARSLIVATHPDDPYRGLALWLRRQYGHRVRVIVATQGAGGQNAVGPELGEELAALRVRETLAAARQLGVELRFLGLRDFGYCREAAEALDRWRDEGAEQAMQRELVDFAPDFVWTPHSMFETHGQKAAVVELLVRALNSTPRVRPSFFHAPAELEPPRLRWDLRALDPLEGRPFRELAHAALLLHRTQGPHGSVSEEIAPELLFVGTGLAPSEWQSRLDQVEVLRPASGQFSDHLREWLAQPRRLEDWVRELAGLRQRWLGIAARMRPGDRTRERLERRVRALSRALLLSSRVHVEAPAPIEVTSDGEELQAVVRVRNDGEHAVLLTQPPRGSESLLSWKHEEQQLPPGAARVLTIRLQAAGRMLSESTEISLPLRILGQDLSVAVPVELRVKRALQIEARPEQRYLVPAAGAVVRLSLAIRKERPGAWRGQLTMLAPLDVAFLPEANEDPLPIWIQLPERAIDRLVAVRVRLPDYERRAGEGRLPWGERSFRLTGCREQSGEGELSVGFSAGPRAGASRSAHRDRARAR
jgi:LmbE family N-acetylglucosaminyl deacetylase